MKLLILLILVSCGSESFSKPNETPNNPPPVEEPEVKITEVANTIPYGITRIEDNTVICYATPASISCVKK